MIHLSLAIYCTESSLAAPTYSVLTGTATEALPDNPGQVSVTLSEIYQPPEGYEVRYNVSERADDDPNSASFIAPGETQLTDSAFAGKAYVKLYLVRSSDGLVVQQTPLPPIDFAEDAGQQTPLAPRLTDVTASANGATAARATVTTDESSGVLYWVATTSEAAPSASNILAGQDHAGAAAASFGSVPVETAGTVKVAVPDLVAGKAYYLFFAQRDAEGTLSEVERSASVTPIATVIEDLTNPTVQDILDNAPLRTAWQGVSLDDYAADNEATITEVTVTYRLDGDVVANGEVLGKAGDELTIAVNVTASDKTEARFVYGPATISEAPVVDSTPPVLSDFALSASGPAGARGSVTTTEGGGALHWIGTNSNSSTESEIKALFEANDLSPAGLAGSIPVSERGVVPVEFNDLTSETDYTFYCCHKDAAGNRSNIVKASARTLSSENLALTIQDFSRDKVPFHSKLAPGTTEQARQETTTKESVLALADDPTVGSQHQGEYKIPGKDALPNGVSASGKSINVAGGFSGWLEGWDFTGYQINWRGSEIRIRNSILGERDGPVGIYAYLDIYPDATLVEISNNDILGPNGYGGAGVAIKYRTSGSGASAKGPRMAPGRVARNRFFGLSSDALKPTGGILVENAILYDSNLDGPALVWSSTQSYAKDQLTRNDANNVFRSKSNGNRGNLIPSGKSDTAYWESLDPHCDAINPATVTDPLLIQANYVSLNANSDRSVGMNNAIRSVPNSGSTMPHKQVDVTENVLIGPAHNRSKLIQADDNGNPNHIPDRFYNNWIRAEDQNSILHPRVAPNTVWETNRDLSTDEIIPGTSDTISVPSLAKTSVPAPTPPAYLAKVTRSGTATAGHIIEARAVPEGDASPTEWVEIATADSQGHWTGTLDVPRGPHPYQFEVRLKDAHYVSAKTTRTFVSGVLIAMQTQSDIASPTLHTRAPWVKMDPEPLLKDNLVQMFYLEGFGMDAPEQPEENLRHVFLSNKTPYSPGMVAIANTFIDLMPNTPVAFIMHTVSGTSPFQMADDREKKRVWENDKKLHDFATRDGNKVGLQVNYFSSSLTGIGRFYGAAAAPIFTGKTLEGRVFNPATDNPHEFTHWGASRRIDHMYTEIYDPSFTKTMILPIAAIEEEDSIYKLIDAFPSLKLGKFDLYNSSVSGRYNESQNRMDDTNHANSYKEWGGPRRMRMWALSMIEALGEQPVDQPLLDIVEAAPNGDPNMVRIGSTSGPISTLRKQLGLPELKSSKHAAYGNGVYGIYVNGTYVDAYIGDETGKPAKQGWIYVPRPSGNFRDSDIIGTRSVGFARNQEHVPSSGNPGSVDYYLDDAVLSKPVVPSDIYHVWGLHAIMPRKAGDIFHYSDVVSGKWAGTVPPSQEPDKVEDPAPMPEDTPIEGDLDTAPTPAEPSTPSDTSDYTADFSTDLSASPLITASSDAILRHEPGATQTFSKNGSLTGALEMTGNGFSDTHFTFVPNVSLAAGQTFEIDLAAYASSLADQNSAMSIDLYCDYGSGTEHLSQILPSTAVSPGMILADIKGQRFTCKRANGKPKFEFFIDNPRHDKRRISLMQLAVRPL